MRHDPGRSHALLCCCLSRRHFLELPSSLRWRRGLLASFHVRFLLRATLWHVCPCPAPFAPLEADLSTSKQYLRPQGERRVRVIYIVYASERSGTAVWLNSYNTVTKKWIEMDRIGEWVIPQIISYASTETDTSCKNFFSRERDSIELQILKL